MPLVVSRQRRLNLCVIRRALVLIGCLSVLIPSVSFAQPTDPDGDGMPTAWEMFFGLNPNDPGDGTSDPDGDGVTSAQEFQRGTHPFGLHQRYFAEGSTGFFRESLGLVNPNTTETAHINLKFTTETGQVFAHQLTLGPRQRQTVSVNTLLGSFAGAVSALVESDVFVASDRLMQWGATGYGSSLDSGVAAPSTQWYFSEGATSIFDLYYLLQNPGTSPATVTITFLPESGPAVTRTYTVPAQRRVTVYINGISGMPSSLMGAAISSTAPIVAERAMYFNAGGVIFAAGSAGSGAPALAQDWYFAEGATGVFFDEFLTIANPGLTPTNVTVSYVLSTGVVSKTYSVGAQKRRTIWLNLEALSPGLFGIGMGSVAAVVHGDQPIVAERAMWWPRLGLPSWYETHAAHGSTAPGSTWIVPEGAVNGDPDQQTYILALNPTATPGTVNMTLIFDDGTTANKSFPINARQRLTVNVAPEFNITNKRFSALINSSGLPIVVDYARYWPSFGMTWAAGAATVGVADGTVPLDTVPRVVSTLPANGATNVTQDGNLSVTFNEPVNVTPTAFVLECPSGTPIALTNLTASPATSFTLDPGVSLPTNTTCQLRVVASQVSDADALDPPDRPLSDTVVSFTTAACPGLDVQPESLPAVTAGTPYGPVSLTLAGATGAVTWAVTSGTLPTGITLSPAGQFSGTTSNTGSFPITVQGTDANSCSAVRNYTLAVNCPGITISPSSVPNATTMVAYSQTFTATGTTGAQTWSVLSGTLPAGLTLSAAGVLSGTPTQSGAFTFQVQVQDASGCTSTITVTLTVNCNVITVTPGMLPDGLAGAAYSQMFAAAGAVAPVTFAVTAGTLPGGLTLSPAGVLSGTPTTSGTFTFTVTATDAAGCAGLVSITLTITCPTITLSPASLPGGTTGTPYSQTVTASGTVGAATFAVTAGALPVGLTLASNGQLTGTPTAAGTYNFTVTATDTAGCTGTQSYTIEIVCPVITLAPSTLPNASTGTAYSQTVSGVGGTAPYTFAVTSGSVPTGLTFAANGQLTGTPTTAGSFSFTVTATDANGCTGTQSYTIQVLCPVITLSPASLPGGTAGTAYSQMVSAVGGTAPYTFAVTSGSVPTGLTFAANGQLTGTPTVAGTYTFTVTATDANGCTGTQVYTIEIVCPVITLSPPTLPDGTTGIAYAQTITATGAVGATTFAVVGPGSLPPGLTLSPGGALTGTPTAAGVYTFTVQATDSNGCIGTQVYTLTIICPTITVGPSTVPDATAGSPYSQALNATGGTTPHTFAVTGGALPSGLTLSTAGVISGTPTTNGPFTFTVTATDANGCTGTVTITLTVLCPVITVTPTTVPDATAGSPYSTTFLQTGGVGTTTFSIASGALPTGVTLAANGVLSGTPTVVGTFTFTVRATDSNGCFGEVTVTLTVHCQVITVTPPATSVFEAGTPFSVTFTQTNAIGTATFTTASTLPAGVTLSTSGVLSGTPTVTGAFPIVVTVTDSNGCTGTSPTYNLVIRVNAVDDTLPVTIIGNVFNDSSAFFTVTANDISTNPLTVSSFQAATANGGTISMVTSGANIGRFTYNPPRGFEGTDTFQYTITDGVTSDTATVSIPVTGVIWFVNNAPGACASDCNGRQTHPYTSITALHNDNGDGGSHPAAGDTIFIHEHTAAHTGTLTLLANQKLIGQEAGAALHVAGGHTLPAGSTLPAMNLVNPAISEISSGGAATVTLSTNNLVRGIRLRTTAAGTTGIKGTNFGTLTAQEVHVVGSGIGVDLRTGALATTFHSISAGSAGALFGINLENTTGSFTVTGDGTTPGSGGTLQTTTGAGSGGVVLTNVTNVALHFMNIQNHANEGIRGNGVNGFTLNRATVSGNGDAAGEAGVEFVNLAGTANITNTMVTGSAQENMAVRNTAGTLTMTVTNSDFTATSAIGADGFLADAASNANITVSVTGSRFSSNRDDHFQAVAANNGVLNVTFTGNTLRGGHATALSQGVTIAAATGVPGFAGSVKYNIANNDIRGAVLNAIMVNLGTSGSGSTMEGTIANNTIGVTGTSQSCSTQGSGIGIDAHGNGTHRVLIENNQIFQCFDRGITVLANDGGGNLQLTVRNNTVSHTDGATSREAFFLNAGSADPNIFGLPDAHNVCLNLGGGGANTFGPATEPGIVGRFRVRQRFNTTVRLPGYADTAGDTAAVIAFLGSQNGGVTGTATVNFPAGGGGFVGGAACTLPTP